MKIWLEILSGPQAGQKKLVQEGLVIGRNQGDWHVKDPRISSLHAVVQKHPKGFFMLVDAGSRHQIIYKGQKVTKVALIPGVQFYLGQTLFKVVESSGDFDPMKLDPANPVRSLAEWIFQFSSFRTQASQSGEFQEPQKILFYRPVQVEWIRGLQAPKKVVITWGPRTFGPIFADFPISQWDDKQMAFEIYPTSHKIGIFVPYPEKVQVNFGYRMRWEFDDPTILTLSGSEIRISWYPS